MKPQAASAWREALNALLRREASPPHKFGHQPRLYALAVRIAQASPGLNVDDDIVFAAAFLHDLGVFQGNRPEEPSALAAWDHVGYTCARAPALLRQLGFPVDKIEAVLEVVRQHQPHDQPTSAEATLLRDADILEQLGAIGILRTASKIGSDTRFHTFENARHSLQNAVECLPAQLRLPAARSLAEPRIAIHHQFLAALRAEAEDNLG